MPLDELMPLVRRVRLLENPHGDAMKLLSSASLSPPREAIELPLIKFRRKEQTSLPATVYWDSIRISLGLY